jgi:formylmethanofuran dehydrogenase subunit E
MSNSHYDCDRCGEHTPNGDGIYHDGQRLCCDCAEIVAFWETIEA